MVKTEHHFHLCEGMRVGDLVDMVTPLISIDEFESKVDDSAIVLGFYIADQDAASDLNRFIQRSPVDLLDTDVSPAPDQFGHYMVFVELMANTKTAENIEFILAEVSPLCGIESWQMEVRGEADIMDFSAERLAAILKRNGSFDAQQKQHTSEGRAKNCATDAIEFLRESDLLDVVVLDKNLSKLLSVRTSKGWYTSEILAVCETYQDCLPYIGESTGIDLDASALRNCNRVQNMLGASWSVSSIGGKQLWSNMDEARYIVVNA